MRAMENMGEVLIFSAIMGSPGIAGTSYEVCVCVHMCVCMCVCVCVCTTACIFSIKIGKGSLYQREKCT